MISYATVRRVAGIEGVEVTLPKEISFEMLWEFLDDEFSTKFLLEPTGEGARVFFDQNSRKEFDRLLLHFWDYQGPKRLVNPKELHATAAS